MPKFTLFNSLVNREVTGKLFTSKKECKALTLIRSRLLASTKNPDSLTESINLLELACELNCPYSSFVLGYLYLDPLLKKQAKGSTRYHWFNLSNGFINDIYDKDKSHSLDLILLEKLIVPDFNKAMLYLKYSAKLDNPQASLWLSRLKLLDTSTHDDLSTYFAIECHVKKAVLIIFKNGDILSCQFDLDDLIFLGEMSPDFASRLLKENIFIDFLIDNDQVCGNTNFRYIHKLISSSYEVAQSFLSDEAFLEKFNPYQKSEIINKALKAYPELYDDLSDTFASKRYKLN